ncbi:MULTISPECIES: peptidylprolyl isomerase [Prochlorococcus]|uniref:peptidylprolyl isomerase n=1 Tax=Prochlorococcus TaxID=1218 RepID=UPI0005337915|nr:MULTISPECIES: peptidylprolyl isomerase [Prochlorococcus]KGG12118.1 Peptidyl-prolyl cis-trans isomerase [Prochlorococcus sp. MIT 0601]
MNFLKKCSFLFLVLSLSPLFSACVIQKNNNSSNNFCINKTIQCINTTHTIEMVTNKGVITLEIDGKSAPLTVGNFLDLINRGVYKHTTFHRVINDPIPFVIQGGDPMSKKLKTNKNIIGTGHFINPEKGNARFIPLEIKLRNETLPRYNQLISSQDDFSRIILTHQRGSLSMARSESLNSASAQFYISLRDLPELDGRYAVFGKVVKGINVLNKIKEGDYIINVKSIGEN